MPHLGVDVVGEIQGRGASRQIHHIASRREDIDAVLKDLRLELVHEVAGIGNVFLPLQELAQPGDFTIEGVIPATALLIAPVGCHAQFVTLMHLVGADLDFHRLALRTNDRRVDGLVVVLLGCGNVVVELAGDVLP